MLETVAADQIRVSIGGHTDRGLKPSNQDFHGALVPDEAGDARKLKGIVLALADGISSSRVSHIAAETAVKSFLTDYYCTSDAWSAKTAGQRVISATNSWLHAQTRQHHLHEDMDRGFLCTFSALVLKGRTGHVFHIGDSRVSRIAGGSLEQLTTSHRIVLSQTEGYLSRALGLASSVDIEYLAFDLHPNDVFVLTTDGVHDHVSVRELASLVVANDNLDLAAGAIVAKALTNGSSDNLTVQIVRIDQLPSPGAGDILGDADLPPPATLPHVPSFFDGYQVLRQIHASHRSHIFAAVDPDSGETVALKFPSAEGREDRRYLQRLAMEEWIARRISSPHVLAAAKAPHDRKTLYVVSELIEGQTLRQWMTDTPRPALETVRAIVEQIARGLNAFHRKDMVHQDLRPENVMIDRFGTVKIIDFGAVRVSGVLEAFPELDSGDILGTHQYAAPEYFVGESGTDRSDLYSLAVIAYELLTGHLPYGARMAIADTPVRQSRVAYRPLATYRPDMPQWIDRALAKALHPNPVKRHEALSEFTHDLRQPRQGFSSDRAVPLVERNPVLFWQIVSLLLATAVVILVAWR